MGQSAPLSDAVLRRLVPELRRHPTTVILLAYADGKAIGLATCFVGFSTFAARPLLNVHDFAVLPEFRGVGVGRRLLAAIEDKARALACRKVTLEVQEKNGWLLAEALRQTPRSDEAAVLHYAKVGCALLEPYCTRKGLRQMRQILSGACDES